MDYLKVNLQNVEKKRLREPGDFFELDRNYQVTYLQAAFLAPPVLSAATLINATLFETLVVHSHEGGSSNLRHRVLDLRMPEQGELKRSASQELELDNVVRPPSRHCAMNLSGCSIQEDGLDDAELLTENHSPVTE